MGNWKMCIKRKHWTELILIETGIKNRWLNSLLIFNEEMYTELRKNEWI